MEVKVRSLLEASDVDARIKRIAFKNPSVRTDVIKTNASRHFFEYIAAYGGTPHAHAMIAAARYLGVPDDNPFLSDVSSNMNEVYWYRSMIEDVGILVSEAEMLQLLHDNICAIVICPDGYVLLGRGN